MDKLLLIFVTFLSITVFSQSSGKYDNEKYALFHRAEELFQKEQYSAARKEFKNFIEINKDKNDPLFQKALYYEGISALELYNNDAIQLLEKFIFEYPESIYKTSIYFKIARYHFQKKNYKETLTYLSKLKTTEIPKDELDEYYFKIGISHFNLENFQEARSAFYEIKDGKSQYAAPALYYYSHIAYQDKSYQIALEGFEKLSTNKAYKEVIPYYITQIYYLQGRYDEVTKFAPYLVDSVKEVSRAGMSHIIGDAFYRVGKYHEAAPFLETYNKSTNTTRDEDYQLAYTYYRSNMYDKAVKLFDKVTKQKDSIAQIAYYHIAESYLKQGKESFARAAFKEAYELNFNKKIQEDALYNYANLSYQTNIDPYGEALSSFLLYLEKYPKSDRKNEVYQNLVNVYTTTKNYEMALQSLEKLSEKDIRLKSAYQLIAYNRGIELYQKGDFSKAITAFEKSNKYPIDTKISALNIYWIAESNFNLKNYPTAISEFKAFINAPGAGVTNLKADAYYNLGYALIANKSKDDKAIIEAFRNFLDQKNSDKKKEADALMRIADNYYVNSKNEQAIEHYKKVVNLNIAYQDQALYYLARTYGLIDNKKIGTESKIKYLKTIVNDYPKSKYHLLAIAEIGKSYRYLNDYDNALKYFNQIIDEHGNSNILKETWIDIADIYQKKNVYDKAEAVYLDILSKYSADRSTCKSCVESLVEIYRVQKNPSKIENIVTQYPCSDYTVNDAEEIFYHNSVQPYLDSNYREAIPELNAFINKFPKGKYTLEMKAHLADCYYQIKDTETAIANYEALLDEPKTKYSELGAIRVSKYYYNTKDYEKALFYYHKLEKLTSSPEIIYNTNIGLTRTNFFLEFWDEAMRYAQIVLQDKQIVNSIKLETEFINGISAVKLNDTQAANKSLNWVTQNSNTEFAAEAYYNLAKMNFSNSELNNAETEIRALLKMNPGYDYWIAKGLMLQSQILIAKQDLFQAEHTLLSVIENYPNPNDGIISEANELMNELIQLKNKPKDIEENVAPVIEIGN